MLIPIFQAWSTHGTAVFQFAFPAPDLWKNSAERNKSRRRNLRSTFPANDSAAAEGWTLLICPSPCPRFDWQPWGGGKGVGWRGSVLVGVFAPVWTWGRRGALRDAWERRQHLLSGGAALRHSSAEQRGEELCGRDGWPSVNWRNAHNKPLWLLEKYRQIPPSPSFLFLGDFLAFDIVQSRSLLHV